MTDGSVPRPPLTPESEGTITPHRRYHITHSGRRSEREFFYFHEGELEALSPRQRQVLKLRSGMVDGEPRTLEQTGQELGIRAERVRQIQFRALWKCREQREGPRNATAPSPPR